MPATTRKVRPTNRLMAESTDLPEKPLRPRQCHKYLQKKLASEFPVIVRGFLEEARNGSCAHMKLAVELLEPPKQPKRRKGSAQRFLEELSETN